MLSIDGIFSFETNVKQSFNVLTKPPLKNKPNASIPSHFCL